MIPDCQIFGSIPWTQLRGGGTSDSSMVDDTKVVHGRDNAKNRAHTLTIAHPCIERRKGGASAPKAVSYPATPTFPFRTPGRIAVLFLVIPHAKPPSHSCFRLAISQGRHWKRGRSAGPSSAPRETRRIWHWRYHTRESLLSPFESM